MNRPKSDEYAPYYKDYIDNVDNDVIDELETQASAFAGFIRSVPDDKGDYAYEAGKWTVKQLLGHVIDTERIMTYRALCFARNDSTGLPGFDENLYVENAHFNHRTLEELAEEFNLLRRSNLYFFRSLNDEEINRAGIANGKRMSVRALLFVIAGHVNHHRRIITERYL